MKLYKINKRRKQRLVKGITALHEGMRQEADPVGSLAQLYDTLYQAADHTEKFTAQSQIDTDRRRAMYIGGIAFTAHDAAGLPVNVNLRRVTTFEASGEKHAELSIFTQNPQERVRARLFTRHRDGQWQSEGTVGSIGGSRHLSKVAPEFSKAEAMDKLIGDITLLAANVYPDILPQEPTPGPAHKPVACLPGVKLPPYLPPVSS